MLWSVVVPGSEQPNNMLRWVRSTPAARDLGHQTAVQRSKVMAGLNLRVLAHCGAYLLPALLQLWYRNSILMRNGCQKSSPEVQGCT